MNVSLDTFVNNINPYDITSSPLTITAIGDSGLDDITLWYRYSEDNNLWIGEKNKNIGVRFGIKVFPFTPILNV